MRLTATTPDEDIENPTDHPNVSTSRSAPEYLKEEHGEDVTWYTLGFKGGDATVQFVRAMLVDRIDDDLYRHAELSPHGAFTLFEIHEDDIWTVINEFDDLVDGLGDVWIAGEVDGTTYRVGR